MCAKYMYKLKQNLCIVFKTNTGFFLNTLHLGLEAINQFCFSLFNRQINAPLSGAKCLSLFALP